MKQELTELLNLYKKEKEKYEKKVKILIQKDALKAFYYMGRKDQLINLIFVLERLMSTKS
jgi:hypothetical protein